MRAQLAGLAGTTADYIPHHSFFNSWPSTANPTHARPAPLTEIGNAGPANHQYDLQDFFAAAGAGNLPAVSFLKAAAYQDGHAGYSDPIDEQTFLVNTINFLEKLPSWDCTAVVVMYDDSDGWYDHQMGPIVKTSSVPADALTGPGTCRSGAMVLAGVSGPGRDGPLRLRTETAAASDLALGAAELRRSYGYGPELDHSLHRR